MVLLIFYFIGGAPHPPNSGSPAGQSLGQVKGQNPLSFAMEIIIEIKQFNSGRMASHPFIESSRRYMVFQLRDTITMENLLLFV